MSSKSRGRPKRKGVGDDGCDFGGRFSGGKKVMCGTGRCGSCQNRGKGSSDKRGS